MKRLNILIIFTLLIFQTGFSQLKFVEENTDVSYDTLTYTVYPTTTLFELHVKLVNNYGSTFNTKARRTNVQNITGSENYFCWGTCYSAAVNTSPGNDHVVVLPNDTCNVMLLCYFKPKGNNGQQIIRYSIFDVDGNIDSVSFILVLNVQLPNDPLLLQLPDEDFVTNSNVFINDNIDTNIFSFNDIVYPLNITNNTNVIKQIAVKKKEISVIPGTTNFFSWKSTFSPNVTEDTSGILVYPHSLVADKFKAIYRPNNKIGESIIQYIFYNKYDITDSSYINVHFNGVFNGVNNKNVDVFTYYPNPTKDYLNVNFTNAISNTIEIYNQAGMLVNSYKTAGSNFILDMRNLPNGIYQMKVLNSNSTINKTFIKN